MPKTVTELVDAADARLRELGYSEGTLRAYRTTWKRIESWCEREGHEAFTPDVEAEYLRYAGLEGALGHADVGRLRHARCLLAVQQTGMPPSKLSKRVPALPERHETVLVSWLAEMRARGLRESTIRGQACSVRLFLAGIGPKAVSDIGIGDVTAHMESRHADSRPQTKAQVLYTLRSFLRFLAARGEVDQSVPAALGVIPGHKRSTLPSCYDATEVATALASVKSECPKRDRAIMLLASVPGMRAGDIRRLRLTDMDMASRTVTILQSKTGNALVIPLTDELAAAIADYVRNERPKSDDPHVFLHSRAPFACFEGTTDCFHWVVTGALGRAGVDTDGKHHGTHSLRHSAATGMLADGTPYPVISGVLGHAFPNTTRRYLSVDVESLRPLSLEVPDGR